MRIVEVATEHRLGKISIPPFHVEARGMVVLSVPAISGSADDVALRKMLSQQTQSDGIAVHSSVAVCDLNCLQRYAKRFPGVETLSSIARGLLTADEWMAFSSVFMELPHRHTQRWHTTGWTEMLGLWMADASRTAAAVCVSTSGLDPCGIACILRWAHDTIAKRVGVLMIFYGEVDSTLESNAPTANLVLAKADT